MRNDNAPIIGSGSEERIPLVEGDASDGVAVQPQRLIRFRTQVQIEPQHLPVVGTDQQIITAHMNRHRRYPLGIRQQLLQQRLLHQIVDPDVSLRGDEEIRFRRMEENTLNQAFGFRER